MKLALGEKAPYFSLRGTDSRIYSLSEFADCTAFVVIFTCNHCPYAQANEQRIVELANEFQPRNVKFVAICANDSNGYPEDSFERMVEKAKAVGFPFPYLHDQDQFTAHAYDAQCTPEVYLFDHNLALVYHGSIDDSPRDPSKVTKRFLHNALTATLASQTPTEPLTQVIGCSIKWKV